MLNSDIKHNKMKSILKLALIIVLILIQGILFYNTWVNEYNTILRFYVSCDNKSDAQEVMSSIREEFKKYGIKHYSTAPLFEKPHCYRFVEIEYDENKIKHVKTELKKLD